MSKNNRSTQSTSSDVIEIKNYPASLIHDHVSSDDGSVFQTLSFRFRNAWASLIVIRNFTRSKSISNSAN